MARLLLITDFTELFAHRLLKGVIEYSHASGEPWVVSRMPPSYLREEGLRRVVRWALRWRADVVIGTFDPRDDLSIFRRHGIVAIAQDYIRPFQGIPNITGDYHLTGKMAAEHFLSRGFRNFGFFGYRGVFWSEERLKGLRDTLEEAGFGEALSVYDIQDIENSWTYESRGIEEWLQSIPKPIAVLACDDNQASILMQACHSLGIKIPDEVAVLGIDNDEVLDDLNVPSLSSIEVDVERGGYEAAAMAMRMKADPAYFGEDIVLRPVSIITRMSTNVFATPDQEVVKALKYIHANVENRIGVEDVLVEVPLSRRLLETRFKKVTGTTIYNYISRQRIDHFAHLLVSTKDTVSELAARLDDPDAKSLCRRFKDLKGCTPTEYRERELRKMGS